MPEIKKDLIKLTSGKPYIPGHHEYVITECNTISDIVRHSISCADLEEVMTIIEMDYGERKEKP